MNSTGCPPLLAVDNLFDENASSCTLSIPAFVGLCEMFALVHLTVAAARHTIIGRNSRNRKGGVHQPWTWQASLPYITLFHSWGSFVTIALTPVAWYLYSPSGGFMITTQFSFFAIATELWISKLIRLGARIIPKSGSMVDDGANLKTDKSKIFESLNQPDKILRLLRLLDFCLVLAMIGCGIVAFAIEGKLVFVRATLGFMGMLCVSWSTSATWQYRRCEQAIRQSNINVQAILDDESKARIEKVTRTALQKMHLQRTTLTIFGTVAALLLFLWAGGLIPIQWWFVPFQQLFDAPQQAIVVLSMLFRGKPRSSASQPTSPTSAGFGHNSTKNDQSARTLVATAAQVVHSEQSQI